VNTAAAAALAREWTLEETRVLVEVCIIEAGQEVDAARICFLCCQ